MVIIIAGLTSIGEKKIVRRELRNRLTQHELELYSLQLQPEGELPSNLKGQRPFML